MKLKNILKDTKGMTIVSIMVAFTVLLILMASYTAIARMAARMTEKADDDSKTVEELAEKYYEGSSDLAVTEIERDAKFSNGGTESFELYGAGVHIYSDPSKGTSSRYDLYSFGKHVPVTD